MPKYDITIPEVKDIVFNVTNPCFKELSETRTITFTIDNKLYGVEINAFLPTKLFGKVDITTLTNHELIIGCIFATHTREEAQNYLKEREHV